MPRRSKQSNSTPHRPVDDRATELDRTARRQPCCLFRLRAEERVRINVPPPGAQRVTKSDADIAAMRGRSLRRGILPFLADGTEVPEELLEKYVGPADQTFTAD